MVDRPYFISVDANGIRSCSCKGYMFRKQCKHISLTPQERATQKLLAAKAGKAILPLLKDVTAFQTPSEKAANDPELASFLNQLADTL